MTLSQSITNISNQALFDEVRTYLLNSLIEVDFQESASDNLGSAKKILKLLSKNTMEEAYELLFSLYKHNKTSDIIFLGLAYTNYNLNYYESAWKYALQASKLHGLLGGGTHSELLEAFDKALADIVEKYKNNKMIVNDRFINLYPTQEQIEEVNAADKYVMTGLEPLNPFITKSDKITTIGSCFTGNVSTFLRHNGFNVPILNTEYKGNLPTGSFSDEVFNTYILRYLFELAFSNEVPDEDAYEVVNQHNRKSIFSVEHLKNTFKSSTIFIITLGLSEVWFNKSTGEVYKTAKAVGDYNREVHDFRTTTVAENLTNIEFVYQSIRKNIKEANIIFTLSPVPLKATFRDLGCIPANNVSKATLRIALEELLNTYSEDKLLNYFPSYELIVDFLPRPFKGDRRYLGSDTINFIMTLFANHYIIHDKDL